MELGLLTYAMKRPAVFRPGGEVIHRIVRFKNFRWTLTCLILLLCSRPGAMAQDRGTTEAPPADSRLRVTHILGFEGISHNANGDLSIQGGNLQFHKSKGSPAQIPISSIQNFVVGEENKQVGGVPLALTKAATPYGGGRVIGLFAHKKYDTVTVEYLDANGGFHGAIFQLNKGQGQLLTSELEDNRAHVTRLEQETTQAVARSSDSKAGQWSVQVDRVEPGNVDIEGAFRVAIYENLLDELTKAKQFKQVLRSGDRSANGVAGLLILKTTVEAYTPGSETRRAVTTVSGATKLKVRSQLCTREGQVVLERVSNGNVRFIGGNLRATHNLARNVAHAIKQSTLPEPN